VLNSGSRLNRTQQLAEGNFAFAAHKIIHTHVGVSFRRKTGIVPADNDLYARPQLAHEIDNAPGGAPLKRHDGKSHDFRIQLADQSGHGFANLALHQDEIGDGDAMMGIDVSRKRCQRAVRHAHDGRRHVLKRVRHRE